ncbi:hypothetical protein LSH36_492g03012 [Paralvinella palmiformis]|uniref:TMC domain-containing protein n=1 Tax=Paralvinella palmiformis TaxID=53620 RepID=A0AAD9J8P0_9ANNE|nr:hypothetical protein LSH36_492g03012 [Paralvinella palmiformis]
MEYLPSLTVTILNAMIPPLFNVLVKGEDYCPEFEIQVTLGRAIVSKYNCKLTRMIGRAQFRIPQEVLDLVYSQILCWFVSG